MLDTLKGELIVSAQAYPGEPMRDPRTMCQVALAAERGGAAAIRAQGLDDLRLIAEASDLPLIGLIKDGSEGVFITPTLQHCLDVADAGCEIVALDGTLRPRPDGRTFAETVAELKRLRPGVLVMADCSCLEDGLAAAAAGADLVGTTLAGYTETTTKTEGPDFDLLRGLASQLDIPVIAEGRVHTPSQARECIEAGAYAVVVGTAITHPTTITSWFKAAVTGA
ncbi:N-acetylmannosamine-6-phosphate 2-epimerase [Micrococcales bacterium 31B]|nr:N-acetylmannosamine-6-phosphate 2-epimerase [Micrococcales bacterium 31B]